MKLSKNALSVGFWSSDYKKLAKWYIETFKFTVAMEEELPNDSFVAFQFGECFFWIGQHDKVEGKNKDPYRIMLEFYVESVMNTYLELKTKNVHFVAEPFKEPTSENWCMTIMDPENNILQFYGKK